ncbi:MAG TPA: hypothetical protein VHE30_25285 [Polyangiaceae bacterium]|nr:hypothetical protein [Polyangiaceae bacterium]
MTASERAGSTPASTPGEDTARFGPDAPFALRAVLLVSWTSLVSRSIATALPGARSGLERWIARSDVLASLSSQLSALLGACLLVLLVAATLGDRTLSPVYRVLVVPAAAAVLTLVMLASTMGLEPAESLALGASCLALGASAASSSLRSPVARATGLVLAFLTIGATLRLGYRLLAASGAVRAASPALVGVLTSGANALDVLAVSLAAARFIAERRVRAGITVGVIVLLGAVLSWGAIRGSLEGASLWQIVASRALSELSLASIASPGGGRVAVDVVAVLVALVVGAWPGAISQKMIAVAFALLGRSGAEVPASALVLALAALSSPLGPRESDPLPPVRPGAVGPTPREAGSSG